MKKKSKKKVWIILGVILAIIIIGSLNNQILQNDNDNVKNTNNENLTAPVFNQDEDNESNENQNEEEIPTCDGTSITSDCEVDGIVYSTYKYYPAEEEKYHYETVTTYVREITGYCTLCNDGTYSPTCAVGRGACSHHGGVAEYNSPIYSEVPKQEQKKAIDKEATPEYWEKIIKEDENF